MSNAIQFLESMGRNRLSAAEYSATVASLNIHDEQRHALLNRDHDALSGLLGGRAKLLCSVFPADDDQKEDNQREPEEPNQDTPPELE